MGGLVAVKKYHKALGGVASGETSVAKEVVKRAEDTQDAAVKQAKGAARTYSSINKLVK
jgi:hypothetical protein